MIGSTHLHITGRFAVGLAFFMLFPLALSVAGGHPDSGAFLLALVITAGIGLALTMLFRVKREMRIRDGYILVGLIWTSAGILGALPLYFSGSAGSFVNALFESVSGFTTTGATILSDIEGQSPGILLWRSLTHWLGGMGIIVLSVAFLPRLGAGAMQLFKAEVPGPAAEKLLPRVKETAKVLWGLYVLLTLLQTILLKLAGVSWFDAVNHAFATMATGGFSTHNASVAGFGNPLAEVIILAFMAAAGVNFTIYYYIYNRRWHLIREDSELKFYLFILALAAAALTINLATSGTFANWLSALRHGAFQAVSITTTTGFSSADFDQWPPFARGLLLSLKFLGGSAGSTGGAIKQIRILILLKIGLREFRRLLHPKVITPIRVGAKVIPEEMLHHIAGFFILYLALFLVGGLAVAAMDVDIVSSFSASAACIGNIGPGLELVGPLSNYNLLPGGAKLLLLLLMLLGRLEVYTYLLFLALPFARLTR